MKVIDFGLAGVDEDFGQGEIQVSDAQIRTVDYAALERITKVGAGDHRSDIYFVGCMFYHMLAGKPPLSDTRDPKERALESRFTEVRPIQETAPSVPSVAAAVVAKSMQLAPSLRYQSLGDMLIDLRSCHQSLVNGGKEPARTPDSPSRKSNSSPSKKKKAPAGKTTAANAIPPDAPFFLFVEPQAGLQKVFRQLAKENGCRPLLYTDPERAFERLNSELDRPVLAAILINAEQLGKAAVEVFNRLAEQEFLRDVPAVLLLHNSQDRWKKQVKTAPHRVLLMTPCKVPDLLESLTAALKNSPLNAANQPEPEPDEASDGSGTAETEMMDSFDPYHQWLGIPAQKQPPHHYRLLGVPAFEENLDVIESAADRQAAYVRTFMIGQRSQESKRLLKEITTARSLLLKPDQKADYDHSLHEKIDRQTEDKSSDQPAWKHGQRPRTADELEQCLVASGLLNLAQVRTVRAGLPDGEQDAKQLVQALFRAKKLTKYQAETVFKGKTKGL
ncbi:MAG: hypothetical protein N2C14_13620, partial [Planctomycetales bacterium]